MLIKHFVCQQVFEIKVIYFAMFIDLKNQFQVGFFGGICIPCYELLSKVMPTVTPMLEQCHSNWSNWKQQVEIRKAEKEREKEEKAKLEQEKKDKEAAEEKEKE